MVYLHKIHRLVAVYII